MKRRKVDQTLRVWRLTWSHECGIYWMPVKTVPEYGTEPWPNHVLDIYLNECRRGEPGVTFCLSRGIPALPDNARDLARHVSTFR